MSESIDGLNMQGMFVFEMLPIFFPAIFIGRGDTKMKRDTLKKFAKTLSESASIHYDRGTYSPDTTATTPRRFVKWTIHATLPCVMILCTAFSSFIFLMDLFLEQADLST